MTALTSKRPLLHRSLTLTIVLAICLPLFAGNMVQPTRAPKAMVASVHREAT